MSVSAWPIAMVRDAEWGCNRMGMAFSTPKFTRVTAVSIWGPPSSYWILIFQEFYHSTRTYTVMLLCQDRTFILTHKLFLSYFVPWIQLVFTTVFSEVLLTVSV